MCLRSDCGVCSDSSWQWNKSSGVLQLYRSSSTCVSRSESTRKFRILSNQWSWCLCWNPFPFFPCGMLTLGWRFLGFSGSEGGFDDHCLLYADMTGFELPKKVNVSWQIHWNPHFNYALIPEITIFSRNPLRLGRFQQWPWHRKRHRLVRTGTFPLVAAVYLGTSGRFVFLFCDSPFSMDRVSVVYRSELRGPYESPWKCPMRADARLLWQRHLIPAWELKEEAPRKSQCDLVAALQFIETILVCMLVTTDSGPSWSRSTASSSWLIPMVL